MLQLRFMPGKVNYTERVVLLGRSEDRRFRLSDIQICIHFSTVYTLKNLKKQINVGHHSCKNLNKHRSTSLFLGKDHDVVPVCFVTRVAFGRAESLTSIASLIQCISTVYR